MTKEVMDFVGEFQFINWINLPMGRTIILGKSKKFKNLITNAGRTLFISRLGSNASNFIDHIAVGTGTNEPALSDTTLQTETVRLAATPSAVGTPNWSNTFAAVFTSAQINGTTEIGLINAASTGTLATRSKYPAMSIATGSNLTVAYAIGLISFTIVSGFTLTAAQTKTYQIAMNSAIAVKGVIEADTNNGYAKNTSIAAVEAEPASYWHDTTNNLLYIHCDNDANPSTHTIYVQAGG